jgi:hypothetical protein
MYLAEIVELREKVRLPTETPEDALGIARVLHEIGHILGRYQNSRSTLVREQWAWNWAHEHALVWTPAMERCAAACMAWYAARPPHKLVAPVRPLLDSRGLLVADTRKAAATLPDDARFYRTDAEFAAMRLADLCELASDAIEAVRRQDHQTREPST